MGGEGGGVRVSGWDINKKQTIKNGNAPFYSSKELALEFPQRIIEM